MPYKDKEKQKEHNKEYYQKNKEKLDEDHKKHYHENKEKFKKDKEYMKEYYQNNRERIKERELKRNYGISQDYYNEMFEIQEGRCAICGTHQEELEKAFCVDHNHELGWVRGLLCHSCNSLLGYSKDNKQLLLNAIKYLEVYDGLDS